MSFLKLVGLVMVGLCAVSIGMKKAFSLTEHVRVLELAQLVLDAFSGELVYSLAPPDEIITRLIGRKALSEAKYLKSCKIFCEQGEPFPIAWTKAIKENLSIEDAQILTVLSDTLGRCDLDIELAAIAHAHEQLDLAIKEAREYAQTHGKLYRTIGMLVGAFFIILWL